MSKCRWLFKVFKLSILRKYALCFTCNSLLISHHSTEALEQGKSIQTGALPGRGARPSGVCAWPASRPLRTHAALLCSHGCRGCRRRRSALMKPSRASRWHPLGLMLATLSSHHARCVVLLACTRYSCGVCTTIFILFTISAVFGESVLCVYIFKAINAGAQ